VYLALDAARRFGPEMGSDHRWSALPGPRAPGLKFHLGQN
jgi:hypothetical protein